MNQFLLVGPWHPSGLISVDLSGERDIGQLKEGHFTETLLGITPALNVSAHLQATSFIQYDTTSASIGTNSRLRWEVTPVADLFVVYDHNLHDVDRRWRVDSNQQRVKFQYAFRY